MDKHILNALKDLFKTHPNADEFFRTSDGNYFLTEEAASAHGSRFPNKEVVSYTREEVDEAEPELTAEELKEIAAAKRESILAKFSKAYGFDADEIHNDDALEAAIGYLEEYKKRNPKVECKCTKPTTQPEVKQPEANKPEVKAPEVKPDKKEAPEKPAAKKATTTKV